MLSIHNGFNTTGIIRNLDANMRSQSSAMEKLASGLRINKAADDPAGLVISEQLRSQIAGLERAIQNTEEADNVLGIMDGALGVVQGVLTGMRKLATQAANSGVTSPEQIAALQAEMDASLQSISHIMDTTNVAGQKLLTHLQDEGKLNFGKTENNQDADSAYSAGAEGKPPGWTKDLLKGVDPEMIKNLVGEGEAAVLPLEHDGEVREIDEDSISVLGPPSLEEQIAALDEKDRALYDMGNSLKGLGLSSLGGITQGGENVLTLEDLYSGGAASLSRDPLAAMRIVEQAGRDVLAQRAQIGATMNLRANERAAMEAQLENVTKTESGIRDTDFGLTMVEYARSQILSQTGMRVLDEAMKQNQSILDLFDFSN